MTFTTASILQSKFDPVSSSLRNVPQDNWLLVQPRNHRIDSAVAVKVAECGSAMHRLARQQLCAESPIALIDPHHIRLTRVSIRCQLLVVHHMPVGRKQILVPVIVEVEEAATPAR